MGWMESVPHGHMCATHLEELVVPRAENGYAALKFGLDDCLHEEPHDVEEPRLVHNSDAADAHLKGLERSWVGVGKRKGLVRGLVRGWDGSIELKVSLLWLPA